MSFQGLKKLNTVQKQDYLNRVTRSDQACQQYLTYQQDKLLDKMHKVEQHQMAIDDTS